MATDVSTPAADPSMSDLRSMIEASSPEQAKPETAATEPVEAKPEADSEPADKKQEPKKSDEEPLPDGVQKRIAKEFEKRDRIQAEIDKAVSERKAKEAELANVTKPGSDPVKPTEVKDANAKPVKPSEENFKTWGDYQVALRKFEGEHETWLIAETERRTEAKFTQRQQEAAAKERWDAAVKTHGAEFPKLMESAQQLAPAGLQQAISALDDWSGVAVHLAKNPAQLKELAQRYEANPIAAIATLGRIEAGLKSATKTADTPLPKPPVIEGGKSSASPSVFDVETASMSQLRTHLGKIGKR